MKCPFRKTITKSIENSIYKNEEVTRVEFADCIGEECPFFGKQVTRFDERTMKHETVLRPVCRRADNG